MFYNTIEIERQVILKLSIFVENFTEMLFSTARNLSQFEAIVREKYNHSQLIRR
jgi:hypothetical protein